MKIENLLKNYDVYLTSVFRMSYTLKRKLTKQVYVQKEKKPKLKIFLSSLFQRKNSWTLKSKFKYGFSIAFCKKEKNNIF